jgi:hypothetical protein
MKFLAPKAQSIEGCKGMFPLWTRRAGFGVITIFTGPDKKLYIENDQIMAGTIAYFTNSPNLRVVSYKSALAAEE